MFILFKYYLIQKLCDIINFVMYHCPDGLVLPLALVVQGNVHQPEHLHFSFSGHLVSI